MRGLNADIDEKLMTEPLPCSTIGFRKICVGMTVPVRLRLSTLWNCSAERSKKVCAGPTTAPGILPPAALSSVSTLPYFATIWPHASCTDPASITSIFTNSAVPPAAVMSSTISLPTSAFLPPMMTFAPSRARYFAMQRPRMPVPPVITTT